MASLRDLGLSEYESRTYQALLDQGPATAKELSSSSEVPMGRIYDVLNGLESNGLVRSQAASRPKKYVAVEPDTALDRLVEARKRELDQQAERYESVAADLVDDLDAATPVEGQFWTAAVGPEETVDLLIERLSAADEEIRHVAGMPSAQIDIGAVGQRVLDAFKAALDRGVSVSVLIDPELVETVPDDLRRAYASRLGGHDHYASRASTAIDGTFTLVDDEEVCIEVPNPLDSSEAFAMIDFKDAAFAADVRTVFEEQWMESEPLDFRREIQSP
ncbi:TrmB family transcriptional regulator [Haloplanus aerogenes]|uniref:Sugar-specific transcriptional regulator TrmB n=1 Tax=Haloplanus aerogenes TaxID=660522 RepID=A0A3M0CYP9_9EURY|nr:TrmB family transcriptional regulator [Haloplanus aerogenes]AZH26541.1 TrmB family transcriptional regulator [Haloplanus aerogenes]RMB12769.1 sugar-specific transcriptional regulator TrmB [Haloplanus aerogenes]